MGYVPERGFKDGPGGLTVPRRGSAAPAAADVWVAANTLTFPQGGGYLWIYLNWALGLRAAGCRVTWVEIVDAALPADEVRSLAAVLRARLERYGLEGRLVLCLPNGDPLPAGAGCLDMSAAGEADMLLNISYDAAKGVLDRFPRTVMLDIDPGLTQIWTSEGVLELPKHDLYYTIGASVGRPGSRTSDCGIDWMYTPPCVALDAWPVCEAEPDAPFTTLSNWWNQEWVTFGRYIFLNNKRVGFLRVIDLPSRTPERLQLAICQRLDERGELEPDEARDKEKFEQHGWSVVHAYDIAATPEDYQRYVQRSRGEFSCAKPCYVRFETGWLSDRTVCYLASGKPCVVEHTGAIGYLPDDGGLLRYRTVDEAAECLEIVRADYRRHARLARELAEGVFDARSVVGRIVESALSSRSRTGPSVAARA